MYVHVDILLNLLPFSFTYWNYNILESQCLSSKVSVVQVVALPNGNGMCPEYDNEMSNKVPNLHPGS